MLKVLDLKSGCPKIKFKLFQEAVSHIFNVTLKSQKTYLYGYKRANSGSLLLPKNPTSAQKLVSFIFGSGLLGWKSIAIFKNWPIFSSCFFRSIFLKC